MDICHYGDFVGSGNLIGIFINKFISKSPYNSKKITYIKVYFNNMMKKHVILSIIYRYCFFYFYNFIVLSAYFYIL